MGGAESDEDEDAMTYSTRDGSSRQVEELLFSPPLVTDAQKQHQYVCRHDKLRGAKRCICCGRNINEVALDGEE